MKGRLIYLLLIIPVFILLVPFPGHFPLINWIEAGYSGVAKQMVLSHEYFKIKSVDGNFSNFQPLYVWIEVISMKIFGINEFAIRFPNVLFSIATVFTLFYFGRRLVNAQFGTIWSLFYLSSLIPFLYSRFNTVDPLYNLFIIIGLYCIYKFFLISNKKHKDLFACLSGFFLGLAVLTDGFWIAVILLLSLIVFVIVKMFKVRVKLRHFAIFLLLFIVISFSWYLVELIQGNKAQVITQIKSQFMRLAPVGQNIEGYYPLYLILLLFGSFPASILALNIVRKQRKDDREPLHEFRNWMMIVFLVMIGYKLIVQTAVTDFLTFVFFPLTFFATYVVTKLSEQKETFPKWTLRFILFIGILSGTIVSLFYLVYYYRDFFLNFRVFQKQIIQEIIYSDIMISKIVFIIGLAYITGLIAIFMYSKLTFIHKLIGAILLTIFFNYSLYIFVINPVLEYWQKNSSHLSQYFDIEKLPIGQESGNANIIGVDKASTRVAK